MSTTRKRIAILALALGLLTTGSQAKNQPVVPVALPLSGGSAAHLVSLEAGQNGQTTGQTQTGQGPQEDAQAGPAVEKSRKLSRTYPVVAGRGYSVDTRYGRVQINTWSRSEIRTDVEVVTRAESEDKAQLLQDMIQVQSTEQDAETGGIAFRSHFGAMPRACWSRTKLYEVNYTVWLPKNTPLRVYNSFGEISIASDLTGKTELAVEYGTLRTGRLEGPQNLLRVGNGQAAVSYARQASIDASYSSTRARR
jgi:hypothetical protein